MGRTGSTQGRSLEGHLGRWIAGGLLALVVAGTASPALAAFTCRVNVASGNFSVPGTWTNCNGGIPGAGDTIELWISSTLTVDNAYSVAAISLPAGATGSSWTIAGASVLTVGATGITSARSNDVTISAPLSATTLNVTLSSTGRVIFTSTSNSWTSLAISGAGTGAAEFRTDYRTLGSGTITMAGGRLSFRTDASVDFTNAGARPVNVTATGSSAILVDRLTTGSAYLFTISSLTINTGVTLTMTGGNQCQLVTGTLTTAGTGLVSLIGTPKMGLYVTGTFTESGSPGTWVNRSSASGPTSVDLGEGFQFAGTNTMASPIDGRNAASSSSLLGVNAGGTLTYNGTITAWDTSNRSGRLALVSRGASSTLVLGSTASIIHSDGASGGGSQGMRLRGDANGLIRFANGFNINHTYLDGSMVTQENGVAGLLLVDGVSWETQSTSNIPNQASSFMGFLTAGENSTWKVTTNDQTLNRSFDIPTPSVLTINVDPSRTLTVSGTGLFTGAGTLTKSGTGTLRLTSSGSTFSGTATVNAGTLAVIGSIPSTTTANVNNNGTLTGSGTVGTVNVASGGVLAPGDAGVGTINTGNVAVASGGALTLDIGNTGSNDAVSSSGTITLSSGWKLNLTAATGFPNLGPQRQYTIMTCASCTPSVSGVTLGTVPANWSYFISVVSNTVVLTMRQQGIVLDNTTSQQGATSMLSWSHTVDGSLNNRYLLVGISVRSATVTGVTYGGVTMNSIGTDVNGNVHVYQYGLAAPAAGSNTVLVNLSGPADAVAGAISLANVASSTPTGTFVSAKASNAAPTLTVTSAAGEVVIDTVAVDLAGAATTATKGTAQTERWNLSQGTNVLGSASTVPGAASVAPSWGLGGSRTWVTGAVAIKAANETLAHLFSARAERTGDDIYLNWQTDLEIENVGFRVYREVAGKLTRVNHDLIPGSLLMGSAGVPLVRDRGYNFRDHLPAATHPVRYWIDDVDTSGRATRHGPLDPVTDASLSIGARVQTLLAQDLVSDGGPVPHVDHSATFALPTTPGGGPEMSRRLAGLPAVKIAVRQNGWYRIAAGDLWAAGLATGGDPHQLQLWVNGIEVPILVTGEQDGHLDPGDQLEFYGQAADSPSTDSSIYWLIQGDVAGRRLEAASPPQPGPRLITFTETETLAERTMYFAALRNGAASNFFGASVGKTAVVRTLSAPGLVMADSAPHLKVVLQGLTEVPHQISVTVNGQSLGSLTLEGRQRGEKEFALPAGLLQGGDNQLSLTSSGEVDLVLVDEIQLAYPRALQADRDHLEFLAPGGYLAAVGGFTTDRVRIFDITEPTFPLAVVPTWERQPDGTLSATVTAPGSGTRVILAVADDVAPTPAAMTANRPSHWSDPTPGADLLIISHANFLGAIEPLRQARMSQGLTVAVVDVEDIYDEMTFGQKDPLAIRTFLEQTRQRWQRVPRFVLLVGDASVDPRGFLGQGLQDFVPTMMVDTEMMETSSDGWFVDFDGTGVGAMALGRLPARTPAQASGMVNKTLTYGQAVGVPRAVIAADTNDGEYDFEAAAVDTSGVFPAGWQVERLMRSSAGSDPHAALLARLQSGARVLAYHGHASEEAWAAKLLASADAALLPGEPGVLADMSCLTGFFHDVYRQSLAKALVLVPVGGMAASFSSTGLTRATSHPQMVHVFLDAFVRRGMSLGDAARMARASASDLDARRTWVLLGDPTLLAAPGAASIPQVDPPVVMDSPSSADPGAAPAVPSADPMPPASDSPVPQPSPAPNAVPRPSSHSGCQVASGESGKGGMAVLLLVALELRRRRRAVRPQAARSGR